MTKKKRIAYRLLIILAVAIAAAVVQLVLRNWSAWRLLLDDEARKNCVLSTESFQHVNWTAENQTTTSLSDPMLIYENLDGFIASIRIDLDTEPLPPYVQVFYTNDEHPYFDGEAVVTEREVTGTMLVEIGDDVKDLRIDIGDDPGTVLRAIAVTINPVSIRFSAAIEVAVVLIYLVGKFLFSLQREPDYGLPNKPDARGESRGGDVP